MASMETETRIREGNCPTHGLVTGERQLPKLKFPIVITGVGRGVATMKGFRCPECGAKLS